MTSTGPDGDQDPPPRPVTPHDLLTARLESVLSRLDAGPSNASTGTDIQPDLTAALALAQGLGPYVAASTSPESADLARLAARTRSADWHTMTGGDGGVAVVEQEMLSGHVEGQLLRLLVRIAGARTVLDIGMFSGYSSLAMAEALPRDGHVVACELNPDVAEFARQSFAESDHGGKITIEVGPADRTLSRLSTAGATFDVAFLDADKPGYLGYLSQLLDDGLVGPGGLILADNTLMQGEPYLPGASSENGAAIAVFNRAVADEPRVEQVLLPIRDGLTLMTVLDDG